MELKDIVKKLVGNIDFVGDVLRDLERLENLKVMCELVSEFIGEIDNVVYYNRDVYEVFVVKVRDFVFNFFLCDLGIVND